MVKMFVAGGYAMWMIAILGVACLITAVRFAMRGEPRLLGVMRALSWAVVFSTLSGISSDLTATFLHVARDPDWSKEPLLPLLMGFGESLTPATLGFSLLAICWIIVAVGVRRSKGDA